jgi:hypothetical protein
MPGAQRVIGFAVFALVALAVLVGGHAYLARRLVVNTGLEGTARTAAFVALGLLGASLVAQPFGERLLPHSLARWIAWPAALWMGSAFLLVLALAVADLGVWLVGEPAFAASDGSGPLAAARVRASAALAVATLAGGLGLVSALRGPRLLRHPLALERWPRALDGFRIVQLSDLHIGPILGRRFAAEIVERTNALAPDLVVVTGDLVDGAARWLRDEVAPFAGLRARHGVFFVTGNHDHFSGADAWVEVVRELGWRPLRNERVSIGSGDAVFDLAGVEDRSARFVSPPWREDIDAALAGRDPTRALVLLAHDPGTFARASRRGVDLQLSGHTHGGQIWPFRYAVRLVIPWVEGLHRRNGSTLYVSRGTGFWGPPMRLLAPAEITEHVLRAPDAA